MGMKIIKAFFSSILFFIVGAVLLILGISSVMNYGGKISGANNYVPQEVSVIDIDSTLKRTDEVKAALQKYSDKAKISIKLIVNYRMRGEDGDSYTDRLERLPDSNYADAETFLSFYPSKNDLPVDDRTLLIGMTYDSYAMDFVEFSYSSTESGDDIFQLGNAQAPMILMFQGKTAKGVSPEQAIIDTIDDQLKRVEVYVSAGYQQNDSDAARRSMSGSVIFIIMGLAGVGAGVSAFIAVVKSDSSKPVRKKDDPMQDAMEWYQNKTPRSAPEPDKESKDYYSNLFGGGGKNDED